MKRLFIAVDIPPEVITKVRAIQQHYKEKDFFVGTYPPADQLHITLKFLGDVDPDAIADIDTALKTVYGRPMQARLGAVDVFKEGTRIKIIFIHVVCPDLVKCAKRIDQVLSPFFSAEERPFVSHLTIARVKSVEHKNRLKKELEQIAVEPIHFVISGFALKESTLNKDGAKYIDVTRYTFD